MKELQTHNELVQRRFIALQWELQLQRERTNRRLDSIGIVIVGMGCKYFNAEAKYRYRMNPDDHIGKASRQICLARHDVHFADGSFPPVCSHRS